jgi:hypothetical protein
VFRFLPALPIEEFTSEVMKFQPTIVHLTAHGSKKKLHLSNADKHMVELTGPVLASLLDVSTPPQLIYISACNSQKVAEEVTKLIPMAIGTTADVTNRAARASSVHFYERLLSGSTLLDAFRSSSALLHALEGGRARTVLFPKQGNAGAQVALVDVPKIVARFYSDPQAKKYKADPRPDEAGEFWIDIGVAGCPMDTTQVVFFTDDEEMTDFEPGWADKTRLEYSQVRAAEYARIIRGPPVRGNLWGDWFWTSYRDFRIFATGVTARGTTFSLFTMACDALEAGLRADYYNDANTTLRRQIKTTIGQIRANDGGI